MALHTFSHLCRGEKIGTRLAIRIAPGATLRIDMLRRNERGAPIHVHDNIPVLVMHPVVMMPAEKHAVIQRGFAAIQPGDHMMRIRP